MPHLSIQNETIALMISGCEEFLVITFFCPPVGGQLEKFCVHVVTLFVVVA